MREAFPAGEPTVRFQCEHEHRAERDPLRTLNHRLSSLDVVQPRSTIWTLAALLGIVLAAGVTWATSQLTSQRIGLSSEPLSAGRGLAPRIAIGKQAVRNATHGVSKRSRQTTATKPSATAKTSPSSPTVTLVPRAAVPSTSPSEAVKPSEESEATPPPSAEPAQTPQPSTHSGDDGSGGRSAGSSRDD